MPRPSRRRRVLDSLLASAGVTAGVVSIDDLGIGSAGLNARGNRDEDGTHGRVLLDDGNALLLREYTPVGLVDAYQAKELGMYRVLADAGLPAPTVLASRPGEGRGGHGPATLLADGGGAPLEEVFRAIPPADRPRLWSTVGDLLRRAHEIPVDAAPFLGEAVYQRPWTNFLPYFAKSLRSVRSTRPELGPAIDELLALRRPLQAYLDARPVAIGVAGLGYLPGMLVEDDGRDWRCRTWLNLGYYVSWRDPARDVQLVESAHREWTGADVPQSFYDAYGPRPDELCMVLYEAAGSLARGAAYVRGTSRKGWGPPPFSTAVDALDRLPQTVERVKTLLA